MNWINAKDILPRPMQLCLIFMPRDEVFYVARFFEEAAMERLPFFACLPNMGYVVDNILDIYWIPLSEIPKPEMK